MAKRDIYRNGSVGRRTVEAKKNIVERIMSQIDRDLRMPNPPQLGPKQLAINAYKECIKKGKKEDAIEAAYRVIHEKINVRIGKEVYTKMMIMTWIKEYERENKEMQKDDDAR